MYISGSLISEHSLSARLGGRLPPPVLARLDLPLLGIAGLKTLRGEAKYRVLLGVLSRWGWDMICLTSPSGPGVDRAPFCLQGVE